nr:hypothetical protein [Moritella viscosa]SHO15159.1 Nitrogenase iron-molybdenum protein, alpha chain [Moritella viscosa]
MSGYNEIEWKSNRAIAEEEDGNFPVSYIAKETKLSTDTIKEFFEPVAWHHTSCRYNETDYYCLEEVKKLLKTDSLSIKAFDKSIREQNKDTIEHKGCEVTYLEWSGSQRNTTCTEITITNCRVLIKGKTANVYKGKKLIATKRLTTNGFSFKTPEQLEADKRLAKSINVRVKNTKAKLNDLLKGKKIFICDYFDDDKPLVKTTKKNVVSLFIEQLDLVDQLSYAERTVQQLELTGVARLGLHHHIEII